MDFLFPYDESKLKPLLKMASKRIQIANNKRATQSKHAKREVSKLLADGKDEKAIIRVEHIIRDDFTMEAYEIIELMCSLVHERCKHLSSHDECPVDLLEAVTTVLWASSRVDISELEGIRKQLIKKYGNKFYEEANNNEKNLVNSRVVHKLNISPPSPLLIRKYLKEIAREYEVPWDDESFPIDETGRYKNDTQMGFSVPMAPASGFQHVYEEHTITSVDTNNGLPSYEESIKHASVVDLQPTTIIYGDPKYQDQQQASPHDLEEDPPGKSITSPSYQVLPTPPSQPQPPHDAPSSSQTTSTPTIDDLTLRFAQLKK
mmetsp:Transcript_13253/g.19967  ORF Transcript_13253/g.19967 Transcript_13253/m.19967 type:complete len:318 (-) Transcript_13253:193-1146(-)|eukprot:CAMPEP_0185017892 /NCGR_PEP_ID=MMETSP1103-20130426/759_1 /TAXON_ID=36769 /ORGANISM="Paraphysomonas bandaiensis, Strain Caron Lab Isolate" /LENGTH=317 /DNA_ID=CAMNT_0027547501 /DNA_START=69 /DNA_END=1022 /DNA_ORIENTATION=+